MPVITQRQPQVILCLDLRYLYSDSNIDCRQMHHVETSNTYACYRALFKVLTNHRAGCQSHLHTYKVLTNHRVWYQSNLHTYVSCTHGLLLTGGIGPLPLWYSHPPVSQLHTWTICHWRYWLTAPLIQPPSSESVAHMDYLSLEVYTGYGTMVKMAMTPW